MTVKIQGFTDFAVKQDSIDFSRLLFFYNDMFTNLVIVIDHFTGQVQNIADSQCSVQSKHNNCIIAWVGLLRLIKILEFPQRFLISDWLCRTHILLLVGICMDMQTAVPSAFPIFVFSN